LFLEHPSGYLINKPQCV